MRWIAGWSRLTAPASAAAEQYRTLYYRLERMREVKPMKVIALHLAPCRARARR